MGGPLQPPALRPAPAKVPVGEGACQPAGCCTKWGTQQGGCHRVVHEQMPALTCMCSWASSTCGSACGGRGGHHSPASDHARLGSAVHAAACAGRSAASSVSYSEVSQSGQCGPVASSAHTPVSHPPQRHSAEPPPAAQPLPPGLGWGQSCRRGLELLVLCRTCGHRH